MKYKIYNYLPVLLIILFSSFGNNVLSQTIIKGKVLDALSRQPQEAVSISSASNPNQNTLTDEYGNFSLKLSDNQTNLVISHIGFKSATIKADGKADLKIELQSDAISLEDVKLKSTGVAKFNTLAKIDLALNPVKNTQELLRLVPGLFIDRKSVV